MPLTAAEILANPAYHHVVRDLPPTKKGKVSVAKGRGGPFDVAYEIHGTGPIHIVVSSHCLILPEIEVLFCINLAKVCIIGSSTEWLG